MVNYELTYNNANELQGYTDANWAGSSDDRCSTIGFVFKLSGGAVTWNSKKQPTVALSTTEAEYMALCHSTKESTWVKSLLCELGCHKSTEPINIMCDNQGSIALAKNAVYHARTKHIDVRHHFIREKIEANEIKVSYCSTEEMVADILTKGLGKEKHNRFVREMGIQNRE